MSGLGTGREAGAGKSGSRNAKHPRAHPRQRTGTPPVPSAPTCTDPAGPRRRASDPSDPLEPDGTLVLLMLCAHPALTTASQVALMLRAVGGLTTAQIAQCFVRGIQFEFGFFVNDLDIGFDSVDLVFGKKRLHRFADFGFLLFDCSGLHFQFQERFVNSAYPWFVSCTFNSKSVV